MRANLAQLKNSVTCLSQLIESLDVSFDGVVTDSRKITPGCLFVALRGEHFDAHDFLNDVIKLGAAAVVAERLPANFSLPALVVPDTRLALGEIAHYWRSQFALPVIAVTGSNGKTTVKEMISAILTAAFGGQFALATQGNLNNDIGVPQTIFRINDQHRAAVIELGMNHPGEIAQLAAIAQPTVGLVNNAQREHQEFMQSVEAVAQENGAVILSLPVDGVAVFPANDEYSDLWRSYAGSRKVISFGLAGQHGTSSPEISATHQATDFGSTLQVQIGSAPVEIELAAAGLHSVHNALAAIASCHAIGCSNDAIVAGLQSFKPVSGRLQKKQAHNSAVVIDDTYNANPDSVRAAIDVLAQATGQKILVLGDMGEVGVDGPAYHDEIGMYAKQQGIDVLYTLGTLACHSSATFGNAAQHFEKIEALLENLDTSLTSSSTVLIKGSRFMKMERVVVHLLNAQH
ncbi:UDP-N-acetylmuramoyl-tripeptide--D-alanyl-D-alanine ligase [Solimicrobium silvestre]|uniref:UDP-N-acetylmuramoyl-tripeptide--D-alanyl-D-alanine ligase n=1 Tax=Solimicrobium silvestre TaxID=2099400 RepID=A0A2S9H5H0_9BURK|nr:UDP-N-acetylmuramoyl-tripeptide--D-alanyl-D-alanine ligase [Solimicrobium silvestre]PRC95208.1 murF: UDP-N-acetylmuramoyl-tripeptide--D-alanyl-D-alanine ligase [Solimicrobium silvestre]